VFYTDVRCDDAKLLASGERCAGLVYMADRFQRLNELNTRPR